MKTFYTERDIEDMMHAGLTQIEIDESVVLTDLARERAVTFGMSLKRVENGSGRPAPNKPLAQPGSEKSMPSAGVSPHVPAPLSDVRVEERQQSAANESAVREVRAQEIRSDKQGVIAMKQEFDKDLISIQQARNLAERAYEAQQMFLEFNQEQVDKICKAMAEAAYRESQRLGRLAFEETGFGVAEHKTMKNQLASRQLWESIKDVRTVGIVGEDKPRGIVEIAWPMGVIAGLIPSTNPTSTMISKTMHSVKARNGIVHAPHPSAVKCSIETLQVLCEAGEAAGMPAGLVSSMDKISLPGTQELMRHPCIALILATGGGDMVRVAHSMGKPCYGVGPGNVPCYVDRSADMAKAAYRIVSSKAFDNSLICATEQAVIADKPIASQLRQEMERFGAYFVTPDQAVALGRLLFQPNGAINVRSVGKTPQELARMAGIQVSGNARILVANLDKVGPEEPLSREKLTTVLGWFEADGWQAGCDRCLELVQFGGMGHTLAIHAEDEKVIMEFGLRKPVFRVLVNTMSTLGAVGLTTSLIPSLTLGPGGIGGAITGDNISVTHLFNIKRIAFEISAPPASAMVDARPASAAVPARTTATGNEAHIEEIVRMVLQKLRQG